MTDDHIFNQNAKCYKVMKKEKSFSENIISMVQIYLVFVMKLERRGGGGGGGENV